MAKSVSTYCDFERHGGGWTLLAKTTKKSKWDRSELSSYGKDPLRNEKFSIFGFIDDLKKGDLAEVSFKCKRMKVEYLVCVM